MKETYIPTEDDLNLQRKWYLFDAENVVLGRLASRVAQLLRGKHKTCFTPYMDTGDFVIVINAEKVRVTGRKEEEKIYYRHSGYPGGLKSVNLATLRERKPEEIIQMAVKGMLPHNKLGRKLIKKLKVYRGTEHPHQAQNPELVKL